MTQTTSSRDTVSRASRERRHPRTRARVRSAGNRRSVFLLVAVAMLVTIGLGAMLSASSVVSIRANADQFELFTKQMLWVGLGLGALVIVYDTIGGIRAVIWTDVIQVVVLTVASSHMKTKCSPHGQPNWL